MYFIYSDSTTYHITVLLAFSIHSSAGQAKVLCVAPIEQALPPPALLTTLKARVPGSTFVEPASQKRFLGEFYLVGTAAIARVD